MATDVTKTLGHLHPSGGRDMDQQEQTEWDAVNRHLQHHGFKPVHFTDPMENKNPADLVLLEKKAATEIRLMLKTMVTDSERRQALIQELIQSNSQLKEEVQQQQARAAQQAQRASELQALLDKVKAKVQELEDSYISKAAQQHVQVKQLLQDKREAEKQRQALEQKLTEEKEVIAQLQRKLYFAVKEEERRVARQNQVFQQIRKRSARANSPTDQQVMDIIDVYEAQMQELRTELKAQKGDPGGKSQTDPQLEHHASDVSSKKALLKSYQDQLKETKAQKEELRGEIQRLKQDLESRPTVKELKSCKHQLKRMERIVQQNKLATVEEASRDVNTDVENIEHLPPPVCRTYLKSACKELDVQDLSQLVPILKLRARQAESSLRLVKILSAIRTTLCSPRAPLQLHKQRPSRNSPNEATEGAEFEELLPTVEIWAEQLCSLKELHCALKKLVQRLLPWQPVGGSVTPTDGVRVAELLLMVETLLEETEKSNPKEVRSPTKNSLKSMVSHFQKLFDVRSLSGVYPRMNEVYSKLGEMTNAMRNLRDILQLDDRAPPSEVVNQVANQVAKVSSSTSLTISQELQSLLGTRDIDSIILKLEEHEEFFPAFHTLVQDLLQNLGVQHLDDIVPAVCELKSRAD
ncbi:centrosomal protein of 70 kDa isoform X1 [Anguilla rostrata]|uniref:centrosomal protein of 70 kDa isoform X1 n=3 Tax=Anguilla rostrata TaxID=7938 RepID=UPI0030D01EC7